MSIDDFENEIIKEIKSACKKFRRGGDKEMNVRMAAKIQDIANFYGDEEYMERKDGAR